MEVDRGSTSYNLLDRVALGDSIEKDAWPGLRGDIIARLEKIVRDEFPIPKLPAPAVPAHHANPRLLSLLSSSSAEKLPSQEEDKENAPSIPPSSAPVPSSTTAADVPDQEPGIVPKQLVDMLTEIIRHLQAFTSFPPHTIQRLAELVSNPRAHYKALSSYLHAIDRVVHVTSSTNVYPLPPAMPDDVNEATTNGAGSKDPAESVAWSNLTSSLAGGDEGLGGALLTPIPWLASHSPDSNGDAAAPAQIHSESTQTIDGPNGMGSIETVSVSINGVSSMGHARGVTQGELLRQEQRAGVVPVSQLSRAQEPPSDEEAAAPGRDGTAAVHEDAGEEDQENGLARTGGASETQSGEQPAGHETAGPVVGEEDEEIPHARGPEEIGVGDTGLQSVTTSHMGDGPLDMHDIDVAAAVGRKPGGESSSVVAEQHKPDGDKDDDMGDDNTAEGGDATEADAATSPDSTSSGTKREAETALEGEAAPKKLKEDGAAPKAATLESDAASRDENDMDTDG